jgi:metacaspase-1
VAQGISITIGLNFVDPNRYGGWDGRLRGCEADARAMENLARSKGFESTLLLNGEATAERVKDAIQGAARTLTSGDILLLTYSGHGGRIRDLHNEEADGWDETWVLYDRQLIDDELYALWAQFQPSVRILALSDSCHSGSVTQFRLYEALHQEPAMREFGVLQGAEQPLFRAIPEEKARQNYEQDKRVYDEIEQEYPAGDRGNVSATVILLSGCQDNQLSGDLPAGGVFTQALLRVWDNGSFRGGYAQFHRRIRGQMPPTQSPNYFVVGAVDRAFERQIPFTI